MILRSQPILAPAPTLRAGRVWRPAERWHRALLCCEMFESATYAAALRTIVTAATRLNRAVGEGVDYSRVQPYRVAVQRRVLALDPADQTLVALLIVRELLTDAPDAAMEFDRAVKRAIEWYGVQVTDAHEATARAILADEGGDAP